MIFINSIKVHFSFVKEVIIKKKGKHKYYCKKYSIFLYRDINLTINEKKSFLKNRMVRNVHYHNTKNFPFCPDIQTKLIFRFRVDKIVILDEQR